MSNSAAEGFFFEYFLKCFAILATIKQNKIGERKKKQVIRSQFSIVFIWILDVIGGGL